MDSPNNIPSKLIGSSPRIMDQTYTVDEKSRVFIVNVDGRIDSSALLHGTVALQWDASFNREVRLLSDYRGATEWAVTANDLLQLAQLEIFSAESWRAVLVSSGFGRGVFEFWEKGVTSGNAKVFNYREDAVRWLNEGFPVEKHLT